MAENSITTDGMTELLMMGLTGSGKSATGNSILGRNQFFSKGGWAAVTKEYHLGISEFEGRMLRVVDIPGFEDTDEKTPEAKMDLVIGEIERALVVSRKGFHAVLLIVPYDKRVTIDEKSSIVNFVELFDEQAFRDHGILILTHGDRYRAENQGIEINKWVENLKDNMKWLPEICSNRCVVFDNTTDDLEIKTNQVRELLLCIDSLKDCERYVPKICKPDISGLKKAPDDESKFTAAEIAMNELAALEYLVQCGGSNERVKEQADTVRSTLIKQNITTTDNPMIVSLFWLSKTYDGSQSQKKALSDKIKDLQKYTEKTMAQTSYWGEISKFIKKTFQKLKRTLTKCSVM